jgi:hypothetical protein
MNDNQNNFVTRSTSRVLSEPGGKSSTSFLFGGSKSANVVVVPVNDKDADKTSRTVVNPPDAEEEEDANVVAAVIDSADESKTAIDLSTPTNEQRRCNDVVGGEDTDSATRAGKEENGEGKEETKDTREGGDEEETAISAAARIKRKNEATSFSLFGGGGGFGGGRSSASTVSSNAYASSSTTNSYNVLTDRSTSRVVSFSSLCICVVY